MSVGVRDLHQAAVAEGVALSWRVAYKSIYAVRVGAC